ncbi:hypothetical protein HDF24_23630 [Mucilaginibacter sp. X4EP1]|jgi:hypothetical protein|uniref:hypothetical protein n=1 Tax=Mucilaginibacter sp. X4EP1 TaxID=2723092 RepID=UPI002167A7B3|nr:hypothetical protein [Mucilaginibacter sp. X4EP1]MCS3815925.1 hypothetical protein [Mucilaginibacter sp. X4EP1]
MSQSTADFSNNKEKEPSKIAGFITAAYNIVGIAVGLLALCSDTNRTYLIPSTFYPLLGIILVLLGKEEIKFTSTDKSRPFDSIVLGFAITSIFFVTKSLNGYALFQTANLWLPFIVIGAIILTGLYIAVIKPFKGEIKIQAIVILALGLAYAYGCTKEINCAFDNSDPQIYNAKILAHRAHHGKRDLWYLTLSPWGPMKEIKEQEIDGWLYDHTSVGDTVKVNLKQGLLHIPWVIVKKN